MVERTGLRKRLTSLPKEDFEGLECELDALLASTATAEAVGKTLAQFAELLRGNFEAEREIRPSDEQAIQLITSYKAKGSEWQAVIVPFLAREVRGARPNYPTVIKAPFSGELTVALDGDDVSQEVKDEVQQFERQEMERLLYVAVTRARHTLVLAFDEKIFAKANGQVNPRSQLHWLQGHSGGGSGAGARRVAEGSDNLCSDADASPGKGFETQRGRRSSHFRAAGTYREK